MPRPIRSTLRRPKVWTVNEAIQDCSRREVTCRSSRLQPRVQRDCAVRDVLDRQQQKLMIVLNSCSLLPHYQESSLHGLHLLEVGQLIVNDPQDAMQMRQLENHIVQSAGFRSMSMAQREQFPRLSGCVQNALQDVWPADVITQVLLMYLCIADDQCVPVMTGHGRQEFDVNQQHKQYAMLKQAMHAALVPCQWPTDLLDADLLPYLLPQPLEPLDAGRTFSVWVKDVEARQCVAQRKDGWLDLDAAVIQVSSVSHYEDRDIAKLHWDLIQSHPRRQDDF